MVRVLSSTGFAVDGSVGSTPASASTLLVEVSPSLVGVLTVASASSSSSPLDTLWVVGGRLVRGERLRINDLTRRGMGRVLRVFSFSYLDMRSMEY